MSNVVIFHGRAQLVKNLCQIISRAESPLFDSVAFCNVIIESFYGLLAETVEEYVVAPIQAKLIEMRALLGEMTQPAELLAATIFRR